MFCLSHFPQVVPQWLKKFNIFRRSGMRLKTANLTQTSFDLQSPLLRTLSPTRWQTFMFFAILWLFCAIVMWGLLRKVQTNYFPLLLLLVPFAFLLRNCPQTTPNLQFKAVKKVKSTNKQCSSCLICWLSVSPVIAKNV